MANGKIYQISTYADIQSALIDKYGTYGAGNPSGVRVYYSATASLIFSCSALSDKVIRLYNTNNYASYGDSWTSGDAVNNEVIFGGNSYNATPNARILILTDNLFLFCPFYTAGTNSSRIVIIGKLTNGKFIMLGMYSSAIYSTGTRGIIPSTSEEFYPISSIGVLLASTGEIYKMPLYINKKVGLSEYNTDGSLASIVDISQSFYVATTPTVGAGYFLTIGNMYMEGASTLRLVNGLLVEL